MQQQIATHNSRGTDEPDGVYGTYAASTGLEHHTPGPYMSKVCTSLLYILLLAVSSPVSKEGTMCSKQLLACSRNLANVSLLLQSLAGSPTRLLQKPLPGSKHQAATSQSVQPYKHAMKP